MLEGWGVGGGGVSEDKLTWTPEFLFCLLAFIYSLVVLLLQVCGSSAGWLAVLCPAHHH